MSESRIRDKQVKVYVTEKERKELKSRALKCGMRVSDYVRYALIYSNDLTVVTIDLSKLDRAYKELYRQGVNLNQLARALNTYGADACSREAVESVLEKQCDAILRILSALISIREEAERHKVVIDVEPPDLDGREG